MFEDLIMRLREAPYDWPDADLHYEAADAIEELSVIVRAQKAVLDKYPKWIPVTEQLPKEMVLAHGRDGDIRSLEYSFTKKWWEDDDGYYCDTNYVTHWMPLPSAPTEE